MSFKSRAGRNFIPANTFDFDALIEAAKKDPLSKLNSSGRKQRKSAKQKLANAGLFAPLLLAEGCLSLGKRDIPVAGGGDDDGEPALPTAGGGRTPVNVPPVDAGPVTPVEPVASGAQDDVNFQTSAESALNIAAADLLANDAPAGDTPLELVRVFGASNGTVSLEDGVITFTPNDGFEGMASFRYEARDSNGNITEAGVEIHVGDHGDDHGDGHGDDQGHGGHDDGGHGDDGHGGGGHGGHDDGGHVHPDDPSKAGEHMALMALAPVADATHIAVNNGSWFDPNTWASGEVPGEGAQVVIPDGVTVDYDGQSPVSLFTVRVDGALEFATDVDTFMEVDTLIVSPTGSMTVGTIDNPVAANVEAVIQIADNGPIDVAWDPMLLSRGIVSHGDFQSHGAEKATFLKVAADPMAGDTSLTLEEPPEGWEVGDRLVLTGTKLTSNGNPAAIGDPNSGVTEDEELIITAINGNVISFDRALQFDHDSPRADLKAYVANYTRNVRVETENADGLPVHQRGHVMLMHSDDIDVRYSEFSDLGRTDKSERSFDVGDIANIEADSNVKGRYSLHIHRAGVDNLEDPAMLVGNAVWGSPGWGFVHHDSNAVISDNAAYDVFGAAFVAETGNETGRWTHNIAIKGTGVSGGPKWHEDVAAFDLGRTGAGFWFQGRLVDAVDNVAAGVPGGEGFVYMSRGNGSINVLPENLDQPEALRYLDDALISKPAISSFLGNESIATRSGLVVIKGGPEQAHDIRSVIEDFTAWETQYGVHVQYTGHYTFKDIDVIGTDGSGGAKPAVNGIEVGVNTFDMVFNGINIDGFENGFLFKKETVNMNFPFDGDFRYVIVDPTITNVSTQYFNGDGNDLILTGDDLVAGRLLFDSDLGGFPVAPDFPGKAGLELSGTKTDSIGAAPVSPDWDPVTYDWFSLRGAVEQEGYWTLPDGRHVTAFDQYVSDRATGELIKVAVFVENPDIANLNATGGFTRVDPVYHGVLDLDSAAPVARTDFASVLENGSIDINVLANDFDPDGDPVSIDGLVQAAHGRVHENENGTLTYTPDPNYVGTDEFWYWVEDDNGNFAKASVQVTVEI
ncbi:MAG: cadherin-like domain-containing protein [Pseudomonadota bacterium]